MNIDEKLIQMIESAFCDVKLGDEYTLLEEDFYDSAGVRRHFDQLGSDPLKVYIGKDFGIEFSELKQEILEMPYWPESSKQIALIALNNRQKAINQFDSWREISYEYLNAHLAAIFLSPKAFRYYLPAAITIFIRNNRNYQYCDFFNSIEFILLHNSGEYIKLFNTDQLRCVCSFLESCNNLDKEQVDSTIKQIKLKISNQ
ncbi:MAG: hypothetical protein KGO49_11210, partial [Gammaproteobacteria bacterium]|nr:hypothetical protein [Gammaproteobacteria bacterium]